MFCPKCSQQQVSDETRFCSGCGFELNAVKALLTEENSAGSAAIARPDRALRRRDATIGMFLMFVSAFIVAVITADMPPTNSARFILLIGAWFVLTLLINIKPLIRYFLRGDNSAAPEDDDLSVRQTVSRIAGRGKNALPAAHSVPAADLVMPVVNTAEMARPPSVTERTTNLLDKD